MSEHMTPFLVCYDYGMGGLWGVLMADSRQTILDRYPELDVFASRPAWMSTEYWDELSASEPRTLDAPADGPLVALLADRQSAAGERPSDSRP